MSNEIIFGWVKLDSTQVTKRTQKTLNNKYGKSEKYYIVEFKNGQKVSYTQSNGYISAHENAAYSTTDINGVMGLELIGSKNIDKINITNSEIKYVDVSGDGGGDDVKVTDCIADNSNESNFDGNVFDRFGSHGEIITDKDDNTKIKNRSEDGYTKDGKMMNRTTGFWDIHRFDK